MKNIVYVVCHDVTWEDTPSRSDPFTDYVLAGTAEEAIQKHRKSLEKITYDDTTEKKEKKKIGVKKIRLISVKKELSIDIL